MAATRNGSPFKAMTFSLFMPMEMVEKLRLLVEAHPTRSVAAIVESRRCFIQMIRLAVN
jgi:hypothetical protein